MKLRSAPAPTPSAPPIESIALAICSADRVVVPWSISDDISAARPGLSSGSCAEPARTISRRLTTGCS